MKERYAFLSFRISYFSLYVNSFSQQSEPSQRNTNPYKGLAFSGDV